MILEKKKKAATNGDDKEIEEETKENCSYGVDLDQVLRKQDNSVFRYVGDWNPGFTRQT